MIKVQDIAYFRANFGVGQIIKAQKMLSNDKFTKVDVKIIQIYPFHCLVEDAINPTYRWCEKWIDLMMYGGIS